MPEITELPQLERKSLLKDLDIPSVRDRDPDPDSGPRLNVTGFKLEGIVEFPELGIYKADIEALVEKIRFDLMEEYKVLESGFTEAEIEQISKLLVEIEDETIERHVTELEVQRLVWLVRDLMTRRGVTLGRIETVADEITQFYRERGFILAKAYIPQQQVRDGVVTLTLLLGILGEVQVEGNELYSEEILTSIFDDWYAKPVSKDVVEESLYLLNDFPGVVTTGFFEAGDQVGDTRLKLTVQQEQRYEFNLRLDNHGSEEAGEFRLYGEAKINNLFGNADQLHLAALYAFDPENSEYGQIRYSSRLFSPRFDISAGFSNNDFTLGPGNAEPTDDLDLSGSTIQQDIRATYRIRRSRTNSLIASLKWEEIESQLRIGAFGDAGDLGLDDIVKNLTLGFSYDILDEENGVLHQGDLELIAGDFDKGADVGQDRDYSIFKADYSLLTFWELPFFDTRTRLVYRASLQLSESPLSSINQYSLGGPIRVRAFDSNQFSADRALYTGVDWVFNAPDLFDWGVGSINFKDITRPFIFLDLATGESLALTEDDDDSDAIIAGIGIGLQFSHANVFNGNLQLAFPIEDDFSDDDIEVEENDYKLVFDFQYSFR